MAMASLDDVDNSSAASKTVVEERGHYIDACKLSRCMYIWICMYSYIILAPSVTLTWPDLIPQVLYALWRRERRSPIHSCRPSSWARYGHYLTVDYRILCMYACFLLKLQISSFHPDPKLIKQRLENLIEREYISRDVDANNVRSYVYLPWRADLTYLGERYQWATVCLSVCMYVCVWMCICYEKGKRYDLTITARWACRY